MRNPMWEVVALDFSMACVIAFVDDPCFDLSSEICRCNLCLRCVHAWVSRRWGVPCAWLLELRYAAGVPYIFLGIFGK